MPDDFFNSNEGSQEPQKIKVDDGEYTVDELKELVKQGKMAKEVETKHNTKLDRLMPEYTKATQQVKELQAKLEATESQIAQKQKDIKSDEDLTPEQKRAALKKLEELGGITVENLESKIDKLIESRVSNILAGRDLLADVKAASKWAKDEFGIEASSEDILTYMQENGFRDPKRALKDKFEEQIDKLKQQKWLSSKAPEFRTLSQQSQRKEPLSPDFKDKAKVRKMALEQLLGGNQ